MITLTVGVDDASQIAEARRKVAALAERNGMNGEAQARAALITTELATNLVKHAASGQIAAEFSARGLAVLALDRGPGMANPRACMVDGFSTAGTLGHGLGAVQRQADFVQLASWPGVGTAVLARIDVAAASPHAGPQRSDVAAIVVPKPGEEACGDAWAYLEGGDTRTVFVVDGLGHGPEAAQVAHEAVLQVRRSGQLLPTQIVEDVHRALRPTRGGAIAVAQIAGRSGTISFAGLGNIAGAIVARDGRTRRMVSHNGTAGHNARKIQAFDYPGASGLLVMCSDGIDTRWSLDRYPGVHDFDPLLIAALLYRDHARGRDDVSVVVACL